MTKKTKRIPFISDEKIKNDTLYWDDKSVQVMPGVETPKGKLMYQSRFNKGDCIYCGCHQAELLSLLKEACDSWYYWLNFCDRKQVYQSGMMKSYERIDCIRKKISNL